MDKILVTGITGQDGSYLAEYLLSKGHEVHGIIRRSSTFNTERINHIFDRLHLHYGDLTDVGNITSLVNNIMPDAIYNLSAQSHVKVSYEIPEYTCNVTGLGTLRILEAVRQNKELVNKTKIFQASSSEMFGWALPPQNEDTLMQPNSPYAIAKLFSYNMCRAYREGYGMYICNGITFNHESPRRGLTFVTRKITKFIADYLLGKTKILRLGNLDAKRDWGFAPEYIKLMYSMMSLHKPTDLVIGTGEAVSVREFVKLAFDYVGLPIRFEGEGINERGYVYGNKIVLVVDPVYYRPNEVSWLCADNTKIKGTLNWEPEIGVSDLVKIMIDADLQRNGLSTIGESSKLFKNFSWSTML